MDTFSTVRTELPPFSPQTNGVMWAVLSAYARSLPRGGPEYRQARSLAVNAQREGAMPQGEALVTAAELGLVHYGNITPTGLALAQELMGRLSTPSTILPVPKVEPMSKSPADAYLHQLYAELLAFYAHFLASPEGQSAPRRQDIEVIRDHIQELADGAPSTPRHQICLIDASRHLHAGIGAAELGYPGEGPEFDDAVDTVLRNTGEFLAPYAAHQGTVVQHVVTKLQNGVSPRGHQEVAALIALFMHGVPVKVVRPRTVQAQLHA